jgi:hypothetical protein
MTLSSHALRKLTNGFICLRRSLEGVRLARFEVQDPLSIGEAIVAGIGRERIRV